ncbi:TolC family outer membrane protein [Candidatus Finniella inopinata]|uniref:Type I secretion protein TolC n=1 Tax=Candidatus Finniella inopinata TaxID=1696036 RepID=A0A4Q7DJX1_9PROT|nr:TolC family outer membrane protein [Candidatus Finniella inopinata]RZI46660.1 hypothetical protein EQU50_03495 [Candidatus Finniella inopinata]
MRALISTILLATSLSSAWSATLQQALVNTYNQNPEFKEKQETVKSEHEKIVQALAGWRPTIELSTNMALNKQVNSGNLKDKDFISSYPSSYEGNTRSGTVQLKQNLYKGGGTLAQTRGAENAIRAAWSSLQVTEQKVLLEAIEAYLELLSKFIKVDLYKSNKQALSKNLEDAQEKLRVGEETRTQLANAQKGFADADAKLQQTVAELEGAKATYERITGLKTPQELTKPKAFQHLPKTMEEAFEIAESESPSIIFAQFEHLAAQAEAERITGGLLPTVDFVASSTRNESRTGQNVYGTDSAKSKDYYTNNQVAVQASVPLYEGGTIRSQRRKALEDASQKRIAIDTARLKIKEQVRQVWENYQAAKNNIDNYQKQVEASQVSLDGTTQEMNVGSKVLLDVLNAQRDLLQAQLALVDASKSYCLESYRLLSVIGRLTAKNLKLEVDYFDPQSHYQEIRGSF